MKARKLRVFIGSLFISFGGYYQALYSDSAIPFVLQLIGFGFVYFVAANGDDTQERCRALEYNLRILNELQDDYTRRKDN